VPGSHDGWSHVQFFARLARPSARTRATSSQPASPEALDATTGTTPLEGDTPTGGRRKRRLVLPAAIAAGALVIGGGTAAYAQAHKTVTVDVDGVTHQVSTFAGSVDNLLSQEGITLGARDAVSPSGALSDGAVVTVRSAHQIWVDQDGEQRQVWTTALTADEALDLLAARDPDVQLVASRSSGGRPQLALDLSIDGPARVIVDGGMIDVKDTSTTVAGALEDAGITLEDRDLVSVRNDVHGHPVIVVQRVVVKDVKRVQALKFDSSTTEDEDAYEGEETVVTEGVTGLRLIIDRVTTVDGKETARVEVTNRITRKTVDEVIAVGTKERPAPVVQTPAPSRPGNPSPVGDTTDADSLNWGALAQCESGGNPTIVSSNGLYHGLYQFSVATWQGVGGSGLPSQASSSEQTARAKMLYLRSGAGQWPVCGSRLFS
jgi:resuscitation-promoting factor RpfB